MSNAPIIITPLKRLLVIIKSGNNLIESQSLSSVNANRWWEQAEIASKKAFGEDWRDLVMWEALPNFSSAPDVYYKNRISGAISNIQFVLDELEHTEQDELLQSKHTDIREAEKTQKTTGASNPQVFIVHGHDDAAKLGLKDYLQNTIGLPEPIILHQQPNGGNTIIEKFEYYAKSADLVFVLHTPDDKMAPESSGQAGSYRARPNVIFELGYFLGSMGRKSGRVILLHKGNLEIPSDLSGVIYIDISNGIESAGEDIRKELADLL